MRNQKNNRIAKIPKGFQESHAIVRSTCTFSGRFQGKVRISYWKSFVGRRLNSQSHQDECAK